LEIQTCSQQILCLEESVTVESVWVYHGKRMEHFHTTTYHSRRHSPSNKMKELNKTNKFKHKLGPGGYKTAMSIWTKKEQEIREAGIPDPLEGCTLRIKNWIRDRSHTYDSGQLVT
jgi:hypothetical protein